LYFTAEKGATSYALANAAPPAGTCVAHEVDLTDRKVFNGYHSYPWPIVQGPLKYVTEAVFESEPFAEGTTLTGSFAGNLVTRINKRDFDYVVTVFEEMENGTLFHLGYSLNRASFARDRTKRALLTPGELTTLPFETTFTSRKLAPGSRLLVLLDANKNPSGQVNYGTGKDVSDESVQDAGDPLRIEWCGGSFVRVPVE
jgi:predicted acyl esterase